jgi:hypothetical protein
MRNLRCLHDITPILNPRVKTLLLRLLPWTATRQHDSACDVFRPNILEEVVEPHDPRGHRRICPQQPRPIALLSTCKRNEIVHQAAAKDPVARTRRSSETNTSPDLHELARLKANVVCRSGVVQQVQYSDTRKRLRDNVSEEIGR